MVQYQAGLNICKAYPQAGITGQIGSYTGKSHVLTLSLIKEN